jgi:hypothetical protein
MTQTNRRSEGASEDLRWKWNQTIGSLEDRPGRPGDWTYYNTDGLGKSASDDARVSSLTE